MINNLPFAIVCAIASFTLFAILYMRSRTTWQRAVLVMTAFILTVPAIWFSSNYLLHIPSQAWFYYFHSLPGIETSSGLVGALIGVMFASARLRPYWLKTMMLSILTVFAVVLVVAPFAKPLFFKLDYSKLGDRWKNGVCIQTSGTTCVPASCATVIRILGGTLTERELAREAGTTTRGTEIWYVMRVMPRHGYKMEVHAAKSLDDISAPSVLGLKNGGHVVALMSKSDAGLDIGNPLGSRRRYAAKYTRIGYDIEPIYFVIRPK